MQRETEPVATGMRYWAGILFASVCGTNLGDDVADKLGMGHLAGLIPLGALFAILLAAKRFGLLGAALCYWLALLTLRTGATNIADFATHNLHLTYSAFLPGLAVAIAATLSLRGRAQMTTQADRFGLPRTNATYWAAMLLAGVFGTAAGDASADRWGLAQASLLLCIPTVLLIATQLRVLPRGAARYGALYWLAVAAARSLGTTMGDFLAERHGLGLGLPAATVMSASLLAAILLLGPAGRVRDAGVETGTR